MTDTKIPKRGRPPKARPMTGYERLKAHRDRKREREPGFYQGAYIYVAAGKQGLPVKVGCSKIPTRRASKIAYIWERPDLKIVSTVSIDGDALAAERFVHKLLEDYRVPGEREWFAVTAEYAAEKLTYAGYF
jgi:hypothetical protein